MPDFVNRYADEVEGAGGYSIARIEVEIESGVEVDPAIGVEGIVGKSKRLQ